MKKKLDILNINNICVLIVILFTFVVVYYVKSNPVTGKFIVHNADNTLHMTLHYPYKKCKEIKNDKKNITKIEYKDSKTGEYVQAYATIINKISGGSIDNLEKYYMFDEEYRDKTADDKYKSVKKYDNEKYEIKYHGKNAEGLCDYITTESNNSDKTKYTGNLVYSVNITGNNYLWISIYYSSEKQHDIMDMLKNVVYKCK